MTRTGIMLKAVSVFGTDLTLEIGQRVNLEPATNRHPQTQWFASPITDDPDPDPERCALIGDGDVDVDPK